MGKYFDKFPLVSYGNNVVKNIIARVDFTQQVKNDTNIQFDFTITDDSVSRPDLISDTLYGNPMYDWLIYMNNAIVDPYSQYYLSDEDLNSLIVKKYGSVEEARQKIVCYRNDWSTDPSELDTALYDSLPGDIKKYYKPNLDYYNQVLNYTRIQEDWTTTTNKMIQIAVADASIYTLDQKITQESTGASGFINMVDTTNNIIMLHHITYMFEADDTYLVINEGPIVDGKKMWQNIPDDEAAFWAPVSAYDLEAEKNAEKRYISLIKKEYIPDINKLMALQLSK